MSERSDIKVHAKFGEVGTSQFFGMKYDPLGIPRIIFLEKKDRDATAAGAQVYTHYNTYSDVPKDEDYNLSGVPCDLIDLISKICFE